MDGIRIYWAARNYHSWWGRGNHHFILIRTLSQIGGFPPVLHNGDGFMTLGASNVNDVVTFQANQPGDVEVFRRIITQAPDWETWDPMLEHKVSREGREFAAELVRRCLMFKSNTRTRPVPYELLGDDCAPWIIALLDVCGISMPEIHRIGHLSCYPEHHRLSFPRDMFQRPLSPEPGQPGQPRYHTVERGDWLSKIAIRYYGDMNRWPEIYKANKDQIADPNLIEVGQRLLIP